MISDKEDPRPGGKGLMDALEGAVFIIRPGLYIVKKTMERYGGSIVVKDNQPQGLVFELRLFLL